MNPYLQPVISVAVPAVLIVVVPRRWSMPVMLIWLVLPLPVYFGVIVWEVLTRPPVENALGKAFFGFMLISSITAIPWIILCLIGYGIGHGIRHLLRPAAGKPRAPVQESAPSIPGVPPPLPAASASEWRAVHVGFENDSLTIGGLDVWKHQWRSTDLKPLQLPHPAHPHQTHQYDVYEIGDSSHPVQFAAGELSNGVWGFHVRA